MILYKTDGIRKKFSALTVVKLLTVKRNYFLIYFVYCQILTQDMNGNKQNLPNSEGFWYDFKDSNTNNMPHSQMHNNMQTRLSSR